MLNSPRERLPNEPHTPSGTGNFNGDQLLSVVHGPLTVHTDIHCPDGILRGVVREGNYSQRISRVVNFWKGRYKDELVALRVFMQDPETQELKEVSMPHNPRGGGLFVVVLTDSIVPSRDSGGDGTAQAQ